MFLRREACGFRLRDPLYQDSILHLSQPRLLLGRHVMNERTSLLVLRPVFPLTIVGTVATDAWTLRAAAADQEARLRQINASAAVDADAPPEARPIFSQTGPAHHAFHHPFGFGRVVLSALHILIEVFSVRIVGYDRIP